MDAVYIFTQDIYEEIHSFVYVSVTSWIILEVCIHFLMFNYEINLNYFSNLFLNKIKIDGDPHIRHLLHLED